MQQPQAFNNTFEIKLPCDNGNFLENIPANIYKQDYFNHNQSYESPYLVNINKIKRYDQTNEALVAFNPNNYSNTNF